MKTTLHATGLLAVLTFSNPLTAGLNPSFAGLTSSADWYDLNRANPLLAEANGYNHDFFQSQSGWAQPLVDMSGNTTAGLDKVAGTSLYVGEGGLFSTNVPGGTLFVEDTAPIANVRTILIQVDIENVAGVAESFFSEPILYLNGSSTPLAADYTGAFDAPASTTDNSTIFASQWDVSGFVGTITEYKIEWVMEAFHYNLAIDLDTSDVAYNDLRVVPEPQAYAALAGILGLGLVGMRRFRH